LGGEEPKTLHWSKKAFAVEKRSEPRSTNKKKQTKQQLKDKALELARLIYDIYEEVDTRAKLECRQSDVDMYNKQPNIGGHHA